MLSVGIFKQNKNVMKSYLVAIGLGTLNLVHGGFHLLQFVQSMILLTDSDDHSIWWSLLFSIVGVGSLAIGVKDYLHHRRCEKNIKKDLVVL